MHKIKNKNKFYDSMPKSFGDTVDQIFRYGKSGKNIFVSVVYSNKGKLNFTKFNEIYINQKRIKKRLSKKLHLGFR